MVDGWEEWREAVLGNQERHEKHLLRIDQRLERMATDIATLKVKASIWGAVAGLIGALAVAVLRGL